MTSTEIRSGPTYIIFFPNLGKDFKVEKVFGLNFALGVTTQNKIVFWKPATKLQESNFF